jgi:DNA repair exonuclease SbcCD ATPase subunit
MIEVGSKSKINLHWKVSPYDYSKEKLNSLTSKVSKKYGLPKDKVKVIPEFVMKSDEGDAISITSDIIQNIQDPQFQLKLFQDYLNLNNIADYDFELIKKIDSEINAQIDYQVYDKYRRYSIKWIRWDNFLSYGASNYFDFTNIRNLVLLSGEPANQSGKTTFAIDLLHFLLFGKTTKVATQDKIFNKHIPEATSVVVEGCITIDGCDYIIKRTLSRPALDKRSSKSKTIQKVEYYKVVGDNKEELEDYIDNQQEENSIQTNKAIKEAIGRESDFDLIMSITESSLDDLVNKKEAERGRLLSRWIGLLPIEEKDVIARDTFNSVVKPRLVSNQFNEETLRQEISAYELTVNTLVGNNKKYIKENSTLDKEIDNLEKSKAALLSSKRTIDESLLKIDITTLNKTIERNIAEGKSKAEEIKLIDKEIAEIGEVEFSVEEYDKLQDELSKLDSDIAVMRERYKNIDHNITHLKSSEICPTCHRKLDNVDNSKRIEELSKELEEILVKGKDMGIQKEVLTNKVKSLKTKRENYNKKSTLSVKKSALEVNLERLRAEYKENNSLKKEYEKNSEAIDKNNDIDIQIRNTDVYIRDKRNTKDTNAACIAKNEADIKNYREQISTRINIIEKIKEEEKLIKNWKIYLDLVGKNGITKMVLRKTLPIINARLSQLLGDVCDFDVEVGINLKNEVIFYLIKDGVYSDLSSGSGFELTASALALRAVLADMSTIPRNNFLVFDEILGRVAKENYDNIKHLIEKILSSYDFIINITHLDDFKDFCDYHITVTKENNISKLSLK